MFKEKRAARSEVKRGGTSMVFWQSAELEKTSIEEVSELVASLNQNIYLGQEAKVLHDLSKHPNYFDVKYSFSTAPIRSFNTVNTEPAVSLRYTGVTQLLPQEASYLAY